MQAPGSIIQVRLINNLKSFEKNVFTTIHCQKIKYIIDMHTKCKHKKKMDKEMHKINNEKKSVQ